MRKQLESIYPLTVTLTEKEAIMRKVKLIVHETYQDNRKREDVLMAVLNYTITYHNLKLGSHKEPIQVQGLLRYRPLALLLRNKVL